MSVASFRPTVWTCWNVPSQYDQSWYKGFKINWLVIWKMFFPNKDSIEDTDWSTSDFDNDARLPGTNSQNCNRWKSCSVLSMYKSNAKVMSDADDYDDHQLHDQSVDLFIHCTIGPLDHWIIMVSDATLRMQLALPMHGHPTAIVPTSDVQVFSGVQDGNMMQNASVIDSIMIMWFTLYTHHFSSSTMHMYMNSLPSAS